MPMGIGISLGLGASPKSGMSLASLFAKYGSGMDFTDLDTTKTWGPDGAKLIGQNNTSNSDPISASGQGVAGLIDKSRGLVTTGSELWTGGTDAGTAGYATKSGTKWTVVRNAGGNGVVSVAVTAGKTYRLELDYDVDGGEALHQVYLTASPSTLIQKSFSSPGHGVWYVVPAASTIRFACPNVGYSWSFDNVSIKEVLANSVYQATSGSRPQLTVPGGGAPNYLGHDGSDDCLLSSFVAEGQATIAACFRGSVAGRIIMGGGSNANAHRLYLGLDDGGALSLGWGSDSLSTVTGKSADLRGADAVGLLRGDATRVRLSLNGQQIHSQAPVGTVTGGGSIAIGAYNNGGTQGSFWSGRIYRWVVIPAFVTDAEALYIQRVLGAGIVSF